MKLRRISFRAVFLLSTTLAIFFLLPKDFIVKAIVEEFNAQKMKDSEILRQEENFGTWDELAERIRVRPTRVFAAPDQYPPTGFRGYGILTFKNRIAAPDFPRHMAICQAFVASIPSIGEVRQKQIDQFVTVWPVVSYAPLTELNSGHFISKKRNYNDLRPWDSSFDIDAVCYMAIENYDFARSRDVNDQLVAAKVSTEGKGPFLFGWVPASKFGAKDALILELNLSSVETYSQALSLMESWKSEVETDPELARSGLSVEWFRKKLARWADQRGVQFFRLVGLGNV